MKTKAFFEKVEQWDKKIILKYNRIRGKPFKYLLKFISFFGRETIWLLLLYLFLFIWYDNSLFVYLGTSFLFGLIIVVPIKKKVSRKRPFEVMEDVKLLEREQISKSFPSWHMYNVVAQGLTIGFLLNSPLIAILMLLFAVLVGFSRIQLGVHYPSDVIIGYILGFVGFLLTIFLVGPLFLWIALYFEQISIHPIYHQQINLMLFTNIWYLILCIAFLILVIYSSLHKIVILRKKARKN
jgi:undecaprenyl-diphosphatase